MSDEAGNAPHAFPRNVSIAVIGMRKIAILRQTHMYSMEMCYTPIMESLLNRDRRAYQHEMSTVTRSMPVQEKVRVMPHRDWNVYTQCD